MLRLLTAGESHGQAVTGILEGMPAGVRLSKETINSYLSKRQSGYGRGGRMKIEKDCIQILSGVRGGITLGSPISFMVVNKDYENWVEGMDPFEGNLDYKQVHYPRPGHADLAGAIKYGFDDMRHVLERSSARETTARVAAGSIAGHILSNFNIEWASHVRQIGSISIREKEVAFDALKKAEDSSVRCICKQTEERMMKEIDTAKTKGDTLGGIIEVQVRGLPVGLGSYTHWDRKLDGKLASSLMSIQGIKAVEIGDGFEGVVQPGSLIHDEIFYEEKKGFYHKTNHAGGIEGGMSNGEVLIIRCGMKPIPTLMKPLKTVDFHQKTPHDAAVERSDTCAVPAAAIVAEAAAIFVLADAFMETFGADSMKEMKERWKK
ncbi:chorismate synthase [Tindallia magadiensis]|uniref:Chorismate synthase n=1 Tax=Tindallia magadiensis TaxID=69895 RepID=A0A1I3DNM7_9FIRM|nr:chorismate synthase [Tindallia magadiensis]SFH88340.1 chorismate synthase [Tindallia magadiensis]